MEKISKIISVTPSLKILFKEFNWLNSLASMNILGEGKRNRS